MWLNCLGRLSEGNEVIEKEDMNKSILGIYAVYTAPALPHLICGLIGRSIGGCIFIPEV